MHLEIRHLKLVTAIAETGSVTLAGNRLHLTQSALSHQLRDAEEQLGVPLFERRNRKMALTAAGEELLQSARTVLDELARVEKEIQGSNGNGVAKGVLRLSTECYTVYHWLPPRLRLFQHKFPAVDFQLVIEATDNPFEELLEGKLDLAIVCDPIRNRRIRYTPLFEDEVVIIYPPKEDSTVLTRFLTPAGIAPRKIQEVMLTDVIIEMVRGGLGVAALAKWAVSPQLDSGALVALSLTEQGFRRTWSAAQLRDARTPAYVGEFIQVLAEHPIPECIPRCKLTTRKRAAA